MLDFRGASRYRSEDFRVCFGLETDALKRIRNDMGLTNVEIMVPFVHSLCEAESVVDLLPEHGLQRGVNGLCLNMMCELPSNVLLADKFLQYFYFFSIGSNDLTQLTLALDRNSVLISHLFNECNEALKVLLSMTIKVANDVGKYVGIFGQAPSDHQDFAA